MLKKQHIAAILLALVLLSSSPLMALAEEPVTLKMTFVCLGPLPRDLKLVEEEINKITLREINARVEITPLTMGNFIQQYNLMLSSGEEFDLSAKEKEFYEKRGLSLPKRCKECRAKRRNGGTADGQSKSAEDKPEESAEGK